MTYETLKKLYNNGNNDEDVTADTCICVSHDRTQVTVGQESRQDEESSHDESQAMTDEMAGWIEMMRTFSACHRCDESLTFPRSARDTASLKPS